MATSDMLSTDIVIITGLATKRHLTDRQTGRHTRQNLLKDYQRLPVLSRDHLVVPQ